VSAERDGEAPRLREGVTVEIAGGSARVADAASGFGVEVDGGVARLAAAIDGRRTVADLVALLAAEGVAVAPDDVARVVRLLDSMFLLDNERGRARAAAATRAGRPQPAEEPQVLADARFDCHACGYCCSNGQKFGPITEEDRARILAHDWTAHVPGARGPADLFEELEDSDGGPSKIYLAQRGGRCVFLTGENLCAIHARLGAEAKPHVCRTFPYSAAETPAGVVISLRAECQSLVRSRLTGTPLAPRLVEIGRLAASARETERVGALVQWSAGVAAPFDLADAVRRAAVAALERPGVSHEAALLAVRDLVLGTARRLGDAPGEPEIEAALRFAQGPPAAEPAPPGAAEEALRALAAMLGETFDSTGKAYFFLKAEGDSGPIRLAMHDTVAVAALTLLARLAQAGGVRGRTLPPFDAERLAAIGREEEADHVFRDTARHEVFGWQVSARQPLLSGYAALALRYVLAKWIALREAAAHGRAAMAPEDAYEGVLVATRTLAAPANHRTVVGDVRRLLAFYRGLAFGVL
jgi:Fe-S-cluster containining protein